MENLLNLVVFVSTVILGWIALYVATYTIASAWYSAQLRFFRDPREARLKVIAKRTKEIQETAQGVLDQIQAPAEPKVH